MDTTIALYGYVANSSLGDGVAAIFSHYNDLAETHAVSGLTNVYTINQTNDPVTVDADLYDLLSFSLTMEKETEGYFNPLLGNLSNLWKDHLFPSTEGVAASLPSDNDVQMALAEAEASSLTLLGNNQVQRLGKGQIDLGGIAKGYATEKAKDYLAENSLKYYFLNAGNSSISLGEKNSGDGTWSISFVDLPDLLIYQKDCIIGTSSIKEQEALIDGVSYSHIINPFTGSAKSDWTGVSVIGQDAGVMDALTTVFVLTGPDSSLAQSLETKYSLKSLYYRYHEEGSSLTIEKVSHSFPS